MATQEKNYEVENRTGVDQDRPDANIPVQRLTATSIIGDRVENLQGEPLGKIDDLMINLKKGEIEYAVLESGSFLGIAGKLFAIPFGELRLNPAKRVFILNRDKDFLKECPGFDKTHWPDTNEHSYFENVSLYWGSYVPPFP